MTYTSITLNRAGPIATITLARPDLHNAFDAAMIGELRDAFTALAADDSARVVVLAGAGASFCAGADLHWMRDSLEWTGEQNVADAEALAAMFEAAWSLPKPLIGRIHGLALGGGVGLVACCDLAIERAESLARSVSGAQAFSDWRALVEGPIFEYSDQCR